MKEQGHYTCERNLVLNLDMFNAENYSKFADKVLVKTVPFRQDQCPLEKTEMAKWAQITKGH